eukprot:3971255-Pyramimonas_sp.AAC.1
MSGCGLLLNLGAPYGEGPRGPGHARKNDARAIQADARILIATLEIFMGVELACVIHACRAGDSAASFGRWRAECACAAHRKRPPAIVSGDASAHLGSRAQ